MSLSEYALRMRAYWAASYEARRRDMTLARAVVGAVSASLGGEPWTSAQWLEYFGLPQMEGRRRRLRIEEVPAAAEAAIRRKVERGLLTEEQAKEFFN